jgi:hypothetical protein
MSEFVRDLSQIVLPAVKKVFDRPVFVSICPGRRTKIIKKLFDSKIARIFAA